VDPEARLRVRRPVTEQSGGHPAEVRVRQVREEARPVMVPQPVLSIIPVRFMMHVPENRSVARRLSIDRVAVRNRLPAAAAVTTLTGVHRHRIIAEAGTATATATNQA